MVHPVVPCADPEEEDDADFGDVSFVAKLVWNKGDAARELYMAARVRAVDPTSTFTLTPLPTLCRVRAADVPSASMFAFLRRRASSSDVVYRLVMRNGGATLFAVIASRASQGPVRVLLQGMRELAAAGICHGDLHDENLLADVDGTIRIIDFGSGFITTDQEKLLQDLLAVLDVISEWYKLPESTVPEGVVRKTTMLGQLAPAVASNLEFFPKAVDLWDAAWDDGVSLAHFATLVQTCLVAVRPVPHTPRQGGRLLEAAYQDAVRYGVAGANAASILAPEAQAVLAAWNALLDALLGGLRPSEDVTRVYSLLLSVSSDPKACFWHRVTVLVPLAAACAFVSVHADSSGYVPAGTLEASHPSLVAGVVGALDAFRAGAGADVGSIPTPNPAMAHVVHKVLTEEPQLQGDIGTILNAARHTRH